MIALIQSHGSDTVATVVAGTTFVQFPDNQCNEVTILNETGAKLDILPAGTDSAKYVTISNSSGLTLPTCKSSAEFAVRRNDLSGAAVTVRFLFRKYLRG